MRKTGLIILVSVLNLLPLLGQNFYMYNSIGDKVHYDNFSTKEIYVVFNDNVDINEKNRILKDVNWNFSCERRRKGVLISLPTDSKNDNLIYLEDGTTLDEMVLVIDLLVNYESVKFVGYIYRNQYNRNIGYFDGRLEVRLFRKYGEEKLERPARLLGFEFKRVKSYRAVSYEIIHSCKTNQELAELVNTLYETNLFSAVSPFGCSFLCSRNQVN